MQRFDHTKQSSSEWLGYIHCKRTWNSVGVYQFLFVSCMLQSWHLQSRPRWVHLIRRSLGFIKKPTCLLTQNPLERRSRWRGLLLLFICQGVVSNCTMILFWWRYRFFDDYTKVAKESGSKFSRQNSATVHFDTTTPASRKTSLKNQIDSASFPTISRLSQVAQFLKRREFMLELKRWGRAQVQTEMVEFIALPFPSSKKT